ncbi:hypothetical protein [Paraconexibacter sp. AEG42_29]|uniref:hypothetical protein n=1 Tax=Paraconexibacter sp. AEG42_29 TaxID=2997339 RepID=UPI00339D6859
MALDLPPPPPPAAVASPRAAVARPVSGRIRGFELLKVNQTTTQVARGGSRPLCQAIPFTATRVKLRWTSARRAQVLRLDVRAPGHATRTRTVRVDRAGAGVRVVELTPRGEGLDDEAFPQGRYVFTLRAGTRRLDRTSFVLSGAVRTC